VDLTKLKRQIDSKQADRDSQTLPAARIRFEPPVSVLNQTFKLPGHGLLYCVHGKSYFEPCAATTCRRTQREATARMNKFLKECAPKP